jgi:hypothetical protein
MKPWLAIVAYRCEVAGKPDDSVDIQVRYLKAESEEEVAAILNSQPLQSYENSSGELVTWPLVRVLAAVPFSQEPDGSEVVGFIARSDEFMKWAAGSDNKNPE